MSTILLPVITVPCSRSDEQECMINVCQSYESRHGVSTYECCLLLGVHGCTLKECLVSNVFDYKR